MCYFPCWASNMGPAFWGLAPLSSSGVYSCCCHIWRLQPPGRSRRHPCDLSGHLEKGEYRVPRQSELFRVEGCFCTYKTLPNPHHYCLPLMTPLPLFSKVSLSMAPPIYFAFTHFSGFSQVCLCAFNAILLSPSSKS